jgi:hypothetical protein
LICGIRSAYADDEAEASSPFHASSGVLVMSLIQTTFGFASTAAEVAAGVDLSGRRVVVTGEYISVDLPSRGSIAHWDNYTARYIGWGG